jgi:hypothetical protein
MGAPGTAVTVSGSGFQATPSNNVVEFNHTWGVVSSSTSTSIVTIVPERASSGRLTVSTPYGQAISGTDFIVPPSGYNTSNIGSTGRVAIGSSASVSPTSGQASLLLFDGSKGALLAIGVSADTISSCTIKVFAPDGSLLTTSAAITGSGQGVQLPSLPSDGTYSVVVDPGSNSGSITVAIVGTTVGTLTAGGAPVPIALNTPGQSAQLTFAGTQGDYVSLNVTSVTLATGTVTILTPSGAVLASGTLGPSGLSLQPQLPATGSYTVNIRPSGALAGSLTVAVAATAAPTLAVGSTLNVSSNNTAPVTVTFRGSVGQYFGLSAQVVSNPYNGQVTVLKPDGTQLTQSALASSCTAGRCSGSTIINMGPLSDNGTYTIVLQATSAATAGISLSLLGAIGGAIAVNSSQTVGGFGGQPLLESFTGTAGQYLGLSLLTSVGYNGQITVLNPDGTQLAQGTLTASCVAGTCSGTTILNMGPLPVSGTYTMVIQQTFGGSAPIQLGLWGAVAATVAVDSLQTVGGHGGQPIQASFTGTAGQYLGLNLSTSVAYGGQITVLNPDGTQLAQGTLTASCAGICSGATVVNMGPLPTNGTYTILFQQTSGGSAPIALSLRSSIGGTIAVNGSQSAGPGAGQPVLESFTGTAGQYLGLSASVSGNYNAQISILKPDGTPLMPQGTLSSYCVQGRCSGSTIVNLGPLPTNGAYTILLQETSGGSATVSLSLAAPAGGSLTVNGPRQNASINSGQPILDTFSGVAGQSLSVTVSETSGRITGELVSVLDPGGVQVKQGTFSAGCSTFGCNGSLILTFGPLASSGTYTILLQQTDGTSGTLSVSVATQ